MKTIEVSLRKYSGFQCQLSYWSVKTPKGKIRTLNVKDCEVMMADKPLCPPGDTIGLVINDVPIGLGDHNKRELKKFLKKVLKDLED